MDDDCDLIQRSSKPTPTRATSRRSTPSKGQSFQRGSRTFGRERRTVRSPVEEHPAASRLCRFADHQDLAEETRSQQRIPSTAEERCRQEKPLLGKDQTSGRGNRRSELLPPSCPKGSEAATFGSHLRSAKRSARRGDQHRPGLDDLSLLHLGGHDLLLKENKTEFSGRPTATIYCIRLLPQRLPDILRACSGLLVYQDVCHSFYGT